MKLRTSAVLFCSAFSFLLVFSFPAVLNAEIIQLKNGNAIETKILKEDEKFVTVEAPGGKVKIPKKDIQMIWRGSQGELLEVRGKEVYFAKGMELYKNGRFREAVENFEQARSPGTTNAILYANLGSAYASLGEAQMAEQNFLKALEEKPGNPDILLNLARFYESQKNFKPAIRYYQKLINLKPDDLSIKRSLAYCLYISGDYLRAAKIFEEMGKKNDVVAVCNAAEAYIQADELDQASAILGKLLENPFPVPRTYLLMAEVSRLRKDFSGAEDYYEKALKNDSNSAIVKTGLGRLYVDMNELEKAEAAFNEALAKDPGSLAATRGLAQTFIQKGEFQKAIDLYEQFAGKDPEDPTIASSIGLVYLKMNKPEAALGIFQKILVRNDQDAKAHTNAGLAYALMNDADKALKEWNRALELDPELEPALRNKKILEDALQGNGNEKATPE